VPGGGFTAQCRQISLTSNSLSTPHSFYFPNSALGFVGHVAPSFSYVPFSNLFRLLHLFLQEADLILEIPLKPLTFAFPTIRTVFPFVLTRTAPVF
jgi:hypothetical protein